MGTFSRLLGAIGNFLHIGGPSGPVWNDNAGVVEAKDSTNASYVNVRGADPAVNDDLVTLRYLNAHAGGSTTVRIYGVPQTFTTSLNGPVLMSQFSFDPSIYPATGQTIYLKVVFFCSSASDTCTLAVPANLPNSPKQYAIKVQRSGGVASDSVTVVNCYLEVFY